VGALFCDDHHSEVGFQAAKDLGLRVGAADMRDRGWILILPLAILFPMQATASLAQEAIGTATLVKPQAEGNHGGTRTLAAGANVYPSETIRTGDNGQTDLRFHDNSNLSVGLKSSVRLDKFVYEPNQSAVNAAVEATRGSFRFATGSQGKGSYQIKTPYGIIGVRG